MVKELAAIAIFLTNLNRPDAGKGRMARVSREHRD
jgi:hypothetical protein